MTGLKAGKKSRKKQSEFQKLWVEAERLHKKNIRFRERLDEIVERISTEILPVEKELAWQYVPLLKRLLSLGQRKSLAKWQREELDEWIMEIAAIVQSIGDLPQDLLDAMAAYDAYRHGVELDDTSSVPLHEQLRAHVEQEEREFQEQQESVSDFNQQIIREIVEQKLDEMFGPEPPAPDPQRPSSIDDFFQEELESELQQQYENYHAARNAARQKLMAEAYTEYDAFEEEDVFDFDPFDEAFDSDQSAGTIYTDKPVISNDVFKRLFRSTAAQLHPDRERDPEIREKKNALMTRLLKARKQGDVMAVITMYQEHVAEEAKLSKADERQLLHALRQQVQALKDEQETYSYQSALHTMAYEKFYFPSRKKTEQAFEAHIRQVTATSEEAQSLATNIKSLVTLKPHLEQRYEEHRLMSPFDALDEFFGYTR